MFNCDFVKLFRAVSLTNTAWQLLLLIGYYYTASAAQRLRLLALTPVVPSLSSTTDCVWK